MGKIKIGKIVTTRGLKGEVKILPLSNVEGIFENLNSLFIEENSFDIEFVKHIKNCVSIKLSGIDTPESAMEYIHKFIYVDEEKLPVLEEDNYYLKDILGCRVIDETETELGKLTDVIFTGANDVYEITSKEGKKILIPAVKEFVIDVNTDNKLIKLHLIDGMID